MVDEINAASMIVAPHLKPRSKLEARATGIPSAGIQSVDTDESGTETPWRDTPPTNISSVAETFNDGSPPTDPSIPQEAADAMPEDQVPEEPDPPEADETGLPVVHSRKKIQAKRKR